MSSFCRDSEKQKEIATLESQVYRFTELLSEQRAATKENVTRKQARTGEERDESDDEAEGGESEEDDDDVPYNPKNLPLGWDGKVRKFSRKKITKKICSKKNFYKMALLCPSCHCNNPTFSDR